MTTPAVPGVNSGFLMPDAASPSELFAMTDEQILEIDAAGESAVIPSEARNLASVSDAAQAQQSKRDSSVTSFSRNDGAQDSSQGTAQSSARAATEQSQPSSHQATEPPPWLAAQMRDPWSGDEARELWNGVQQARQEAAAYREVFAKPEDARALKELYPGGVEQARDRKSG